MNNNSVLWSPTSIDKLRVIRFRFVFMIYCEANTFHVVKAKSVFSLDKDCVLKLNQFKNVNIQSMLTKESYSTDCIVMQFNKKISMELQLLLVSQRKMAFQWNDD